MSAISTSVQRFSGFLGNGAADAPVMSIILAVYDPPVWALRAQLDSIAAQTNEAWECVVVDDGSTNAEVRDLVAEWCAAGTNRVLVTRTKNGGIAAATNDGIERSRGEIIAICDHDDVLHPSALQRVIDHFASNPTDDVVYTDEQLIDENGEVIIEYFKPDYSPRRHLGHHYLAHLVAARRHAIGDLRVDAAFEPAQDYDFYLRVIEHGIPLGRGVGHIPEVLYSWRAIAGSSALDAAEKPEMADAVERCSNAALRRRGIAASATNVVHEGSATTSVRLRIKAVNASRIEQTLFEPDSSTGDVAKLIASSTDDLICLVRDDVTIDSDDLAVLASNASLDNVGVVGPFVVCGDDEQESDVLISVGRTVASTLSDPFHGAPADSSGPWGAFFVAREVSAIAPAVIVVERSKFESVGGLRTDVGLDIALVELCSRLAARNHATLVEPAAVARLRTTDRLLDTDPMSVQQRDDDLTVVETRFASVRRERFATTGVSDATQDDRNAYRLARRAIVSGVVELVTSDVFDTIVSRPVSTPSDLFVELGHRLHNASILPSNVSPATFAGGRREAERRARDAQAKLARSELNDLGLSNEQIALDPGVTAPECTLSEIWALVPPLWLAGHAPAAGVQHELDLEADRLSPIPAAIEIFRLAHERGVPVILVSDTYLSAVELSGVLKSAGVEMDLIDEVVTSADHRLGKAGGLLGRVIENRGVAPSAVIHLGDNEIADVRSARELGAAAIHVDVPTSHRHVPMPAIGVRDWSRTHGTDLGISAAVRTTLLGVGSLGDDPSYQYGAGVVGPILAGFSRWVSVSAQRLGASTVHCMLREGAMIAELMSVTAPGGPTPVPLHVSRWVTMRAAVIDAGPDELLTALARRADLTTDHVVRAFGVDERLVRDVLGADRVDASRLMDACEAIAAHDELRGQIAAASADLRTRVLVHLNKTLRFDDGPIVLADVGWGGTIQEGLERILLAGGIEKPVVGLYLAMSSPGEQRVQRGADMHAYLPNEFVDPSAAQDSRAIAHHADTIERLMTPEIGTLLDIDVDGTPITRDATHDRLPATLRSAQNAVRAVVERLAEPSNTLTELTSNQWVDDVALRRAFSKSLAAAITTPTAPLASALGEWPHDDVAGAGQRAIAGTGLETAVRFGNARDFDLIDPAGRNWAAGLVARYNPALSAQLDAARNGASLEGLCPPSENGVARLAAFETGSDLAAVQIGRTPATSPGGWSMLRIEGPVGSLRSIRFDAGEHDSIVDIADLSIRLTTDLSERAEQRRVDDLQAADLVWVSAHPIDSHRFGQRAGGHLIIPIDASIAPHVRSVEVIVGFRSWLPHGDDTLATSPVSQRIGTQSRRVIGGVKRRLQKSELSPRDATIG
jgi:GT2 family glycosyltransferase/FMN phosphatase YigB (HAD superfamily)